MAKRILTRIHDISGQHNTVTNMYMKRKKRIDGGECHPSKKASVVAIADNNDTYKYQYQPCIYIVQYYYIFSLFLLPLQLLMSSLNFLLLVLKGFFDMAYNI